MTTRFGKLVLWVCSVAAVWACATEVQKGNDSPNPTGDTPRPPATSASAVDPDRIKRVSPDVVHTRVTESNALLVCAYENDVAFWAAKLDKAISIKEFEAMVGTLSKQQEIYFYCA